MERICYFCIVCFMLLCGCDDEPNERVNTLTFDYSRKLTNLQVEFPSLIWGRGSIKIYSSSIYPETDHLEFILYKARSVGEELVYYAPLDIRLVSALWDEQLLLPQPSFAGTLTITPMEEYNTYHVVIDGTLSNDKMGVASTIKGSNICTTKTPIILSE